MRKPLSRQFYEAGLLDADRIKQVLDHMASTGMGFRDSVVHLGLMSREDLCEFIARVCGIPFIQNLGGRIDDKTAWKWMPEEIARRFFAVPVSRFENHLTVAMRNPFDVDAVAALETASGCTVSPVLALEDAILEAINKLYVQHASITQIVSEIVVNNEEEIEVMSTFDVLEDIGDEEDDAPVIRLVNSILARAVREQASDIHLEPEERNSRVRHRIDGMLREVMTIPKQVHRALVSRVKIMSEMDIAERRMPQDGRMRIRMADREVDLRVSTLPSIYGEKVVIRVLDYGVAATGLAEVGFEGEMLTRYNGALNQPHGLILVTGPTGSGKTTTLYTSLSAINGKSKNIITIEDPVEYNLAQINQIQVNVKAGITFAAGLRSILRQDPDVIMVGEMRDLETAQMAIRAALTGHLVLSTLHTNDAPGALVRVVEMGVAPYLAASSVIAVLAQRLLRKLCTRCRQPYRPSASLLDALAATRLPKVQVLYGPKGCQACDGTGYKGRLAIIELMMVSENVRVELTNGKPSSEIAKIARREGMIPLWEAGLSKVGQGLTSLDELTRVVKPPEVEMAVHVERPGVVVPMPGAPLATA